MTQLSDDEIENLWWGELDNRSLGSIRAIIAAHDAKQAQGEAVAWGAFYFGGKDDGKLYSHARTEAEIAAYIQQVHQSSDSVTLRADLLYTSPQQGEDARDALRYRFAKSVNNSASAVGIGFLRDATDWPDGFDWIYGDDADAEIDAAIAAQKGGQS